MRRSWAYLFYDFALVVILLLPFALISAFMADRSHAAAIYAVLLAMVIVLSVLVTRFSGLSLRDYWRSLKPRADG